MKLSARPLVEVTGVNAWRPATEIQAYAGDAVDVYLQLIDMERNGGLWMGHEIRGLRYMPAAGATLLITVLQLDSAKQFSRAASQPFPQDPSIWKLSLLATDPIPATASLRLLLTEPGPVVHGAHLQAVLLSSGSNEVC